MGTEEYPVENDYSQFLSAHSGSSNAYTSADNTNYFFDVSSDHFHEALCRFSSFFKAPLFSESCTERELLAVDSEHKKNIQQDYWRLYQLEKDLSDKNHVWNKFGTGNLNTLKLIPESMGLNVRTVLLEFYEKNYSANIMKCVLLGKESIEKLKGFAVELFSTIRNKNVLIPKWDGQPLQREQLQVSF
jgi:insulysin